MEASIYDVVNYRILFSIQLIGSQTIIRKWNIKKKKGNNKTLQELICAMEFQKHKLLCSHTGAE